MHGIKNVRKGGLSVLVKILPVQHVGDGSFGHVKAMLCTFNYWGVVSQGGQSRSQTAVSYASSRQLMKHKRFACMAP